MTPTTSLHMRGWRRNGEQAAATRRKVLAAMKEAAAPLSIETIAALAGISYCRARRALLTLCALRAVAASGAANNRRFSLPATGTGTLTGGPASESAAVPCAGVDPRTAARPGRAAA